ncbi:MAG: outer membrane protein assembly factor BamA [Bacteroidales bacterium]|nr:outer membrane protein assembly factor BamA [Bacteroidales bacterium]
MKKRIHNILYSIGFWLLMLEVGLMSGVANGQTIVGGYDLDYLTPKTYEIGGITFEGAENFDTRVVQLVAGLQVGDKLKLPGEKVSAAVDNLWKQGMFEDVQILVSRIQGNIVFLKIVLKERPRMENFNFKGVKKGEADKLREEIKLVSGDVVTENLLRTSTNKIKGYYIDKGYTRVEVTPTTTPDSNGRLTITFNVNRGKKVKIDSLNFVGNEKVSTIKLQSKMEKTHDAHYFWHLRFWTKPFWKKNRFIENDYREDLNKVIDYYNELGYRDAKVVSDTVWDMVTPDGSAAKGKKSKQSRIRVRVNLYEGQRFVFRNITFSGNTIYSDEVLHRALRIKKGDPYNKKELDQNLTYNPSGTDITSLYMDNGYLFFRATPVEVAVEGDSIDIEIRITEGKQARIRDVWVEGNTITNDKIIMRELHTRPGDLFSREALLRSRRELVTLGYFKEESIIPEPRPNAEEGTVDIVYKVEEGSTSQLNLQGGYGSGMVIGQVGVQLNNFSVRNIFNRKAWAPLPAGDGQKLGLNLVTNGSYYYAVNASFTEPWLGGHRAQSLTGSIYHNLYSNGYYYGKNNPNYYSLRITGGGISFSKRMKWPDDYFVMGHGLSYKLYQLQNYNNLAAGLFANGRANDISYGFTLSRNSLDSPIYARSGSDISLAAYLTPPYSLLSGKDYSEADEQEKYRWVEYYKVNLRGSWMLNVVGDVVLNTRFRFGYLGYYNKDIGTSPFGRYFLGGDGLSSWMLDGREVIPLRGYENNSLNPTAGGSVFDRFTFELRQPIIESATATIWVAGFLEGGNCWADIKEFQPYKMYNSAGLGVRLFMPMLGMIGVDWGYGFDGASGGSQFHFSIGQSLD